MSRRDARPSKWQKLELRGKRPTLDQERKVPTPFRTFGSHGRPVDTGDCGYDLSESPELEGTEKHFPRESESGLRDKGVLDHCKLLHRHMKRDLLTLSDLRLVAPEMVLQYVLLIP